MPIPASNVIILELAGEAEVLRAGQQLWVNARTNQVLNTGDRFRTKSNSRATLRLSDRSQIRVGELAEFQVHVPAVPNASPVHKLWRGIIYFFHRDKPGTFRFDTPSSSAAVRGTEFILGVEDGGASALTLIEGEVEFATTAGRTNIFSYQRAEAQAGQVPRVTSVLRADIPGLVQWGLYYPGVLHLPELGLTPSETNNLRDSLAAWLEGDVLAALERYPKNRASRSDAEHIYRSSLLLAVGQAAAAQTLLESVGPSARQDFGESLLRLVSAIQGRDVPRDVRPRTATGWLAESVVNQAGQDLPAALDAAQEATRRAPDFAFGWVRQAELEFSFGRIRKAKEAADRALALAPRNAQALTLQGFLSAARNDTPEAVRWFERAIAIDGSLANAWLGRGLCRIREGHLEEGRSDLQTAALLEPRRSLLRSYLAKAWQTVHAHEEAMRELNLARDLDPSDPTPWLYSALLQRERNQINSAVLDLERSVELNDNRQIFRSQLLLDQDRAVRSSSLANVYQSAGLADASLREAVRAVSDDYANASAHLFLSESYDAFRDPTRFNLRNETVWFNERLLASLLGPVGSVPLSQNLSQQEYSRLFERDRFGFASATEYRSDGQWREQASQFGTLGPFSYALDLDYQHNDGVRPNNELDRLEWYSTLKYQFTPQDSGLLLVKYQDYHSGDNFQTYSVGPPCSNCFSGGVSFFGGERRYFSYDETQSPIIVAGWHHQWSPGMHTLLLGGRLENDQSFSDRSVPEPVVFRDAAFAVTSVGSDNFDVSHHSELEIYTAELNQIFQTGRHTLVLGGRVQSGEFQTRSYLTYAGTNTGLFTTPAADTRANDDFFRGSAYAYYTLELPTRLRLTGGVAYDDLLYPANFRAPPVSDGEQTHHQVSPKAALVWNPVAPATLRGIYTRSLGGASLDESFRLEPTQLAGFPQSFRTIISESVVGSVAGAEYETLGAGLDLKLPAHIYTGAQIERLTSQVRQTIGTFDYVDFTPPIFPGSTRQHLDYEEQGASAYLSKIIGKEWSAGAQYRFVKSDLRQRLPEIPAAQPGALRIDRAELHNVNLFILFNHASGFFARAETQFYWQQNAADSVELGEGDSFHQVNLWTGWRFPWQRGEAAVGVLNLNDTDYVLNPITPYSELPRERVFAARLLFNF